MRLNGKNLKYKIYWSDYVTKRRFLCNWIIIFVIIIELVNYIDTINTMYHVLKVKYKLAQREHNKLNIKLKKKKK